MQQQGTAAPQAKPAALPAAAVDLLTPEDVAKVLGVPDSDVMAVIQSGELAAKKIGSSYRIKREALDEYLAR
jgi:excisionase family DNA binding protein